MRRRRGDEPDGEIIIPVTPMLDMTFQLLIFFIVTFNPNRAVEGFWDVAVADEVSTRDDNQKTGLKNDAQVLSSKVDKELSYTLKVYFDENNARSYFPSELLTGNTSDEKAADSPENHPRLIDPDEIEKIRDENLRNTAKDIASKDKACFRLTLNYISADGKTGGNDIPLAMIGPSTPGSKPSANKDIKTELTARVKSRLDEVTADHAKTADKALRDAEIALDMNRFKIVIYGDKSLRWWRFNQIRDVCYAAGFRNIQPAMPDSK